MTFRRILGVLLIVFGLFALATGEINYTTRRTVIDIGSVHATADERHRVPLSPVVGIAAIGAGAALLLVRQRERT